MPSFEEQLVASRNAHTAVNALEDAARAQIEQVFLDWETGVLTDRNVRFRLERVVREAYRGSVALAFAHARRQAGLPDWTPERRVFLTPYLKSLLADVRRNLREYKKAGKTPDARNRALLRMRHSAGVAAQRGYTDAIVSAQEEMADLGLVLRKMWVATAAEPCDICVGLHGTEVEVDEPFPIPLGLKVYQDLMGPPAHPHCRCYIAMLVVTPENLGLERTSRR